MSAGEACIVDCCEIDVQYEDARCIKGANNYNRLQYCMYVSRSTVHLEIWCMYVSTYIRHGYGDLFVLAIIEISSLNTTIRIPTGEIEIRISKTFDETFPMLQQYYGFQIICNNCRLFKSRRRFSFRFNFFNF